MLIDDYLKYLKSTEGKSEGTIEQYKNSMNLFMQYLKENKESLTRESVKKIKISDIYGFLDSISGSNGSGSRRNKISALKSFFEYCREIDLLKHNIIKDIKKQPKIAKRIAKYFTLEECQKLIDSIGGRNKARDRMIITLFLNTGLRLEELVNLNVDCITNTSLNIIGKGNKERVIYLDATIINSLKSYLNNTRPESKGESKALFLSERLDRISKNAVQQAVNKAIKNAGLNVECKNDVSVHVLRHTFATLQFQAGVSIRTIQKMLGHEDISTTQIYVQVADDQMIEAARNNPLKSII